MLSMVNAERNTDARATALTHANSAGASIDQEPYIKSDHKSISVPVLAKHEEYASAEAQYHNNSSDSRMTRGALAASTNTVHASQQQQSGTISGGAESDTSTKSRKEKRSTKSKCPPGLRSGKWTPEEEAFTNTIIHYFKRGLLNVEDGTSLRWYLAKRLNCEAMRVTKKLKGNSSIGKQIFRALENTEENREAIAQANSELAIVENLFLESLASTHATAAVAGTASGAIGANSNKKSSPHKASAMVKQPPNLEAKKLVVLSKAKPGFHSRFDQSNVRANSEDAKLLLHFFVEAHDIPTTTATTMTTMDAALMEKKRLFSDVESSQSSSSSDSRSGVAGDDSPPSKRHSVKIENLM
uniref:Uncharacterized protein n=1 Tax=Globisporangium ultimum (strain ATCC 200006 / CBS 805.95 / DAOM BR144) TaxID=431595 RepID=K3WII0_GLOUD